MPDEGKPDVKKKDVWDKLSSLTPLLIGLAVTGVGTYFTNIYNYRQLQLNQVEALDKLRPLLNSEKSEDRAFAYFAFTALGYEDLAVRMISVKQDDAGGRAVLEQIGKSADPGARKRGQFSVERIGPGTCTRGTTGGHPRSGRQDRGWEWGRNGGGRQAAAGFQSAKYGLLPERAEMGRGL